MPALAIPVVGGLLIAVLAPSILTTLLSYAVVISTALLLMLDEQSLHAQAVEETGSRSRSKNPIVLLLLLWAAFYPIAFHRRKKRYGGPSFLAIAIVAVVVFVGGTIANFSRTMGEADQFGSMYAELPACDSKIVVDLLDQTLRDAGVVMTGTFSHQQVSFDEVTQVRVGRARTEIETGYARANYEVSWQDRAKGVVMVRVTGK